VNGRFPDFFIVGFPKCGTTALYQMLRRHPEVFMPDVKEPRFFNDRPARRDRPQYPKTLEEYTALFAAASPDQVAGEASPTYLRSHTAPRAIAELNPDARCIAIVREPASMLRSFHLHQRRSHSQPAKTLREAVSVEGERYSARVRYVEHLRRFREFFPAEQILILIHEEFRRDNEATVREAFRFLGVDDRVPVAQLEVNTAKDVRSFRLDDVVTSMYLGEGPVSARLRSVGKAVLPARLNRVPDRIRLAIVHGRPPAPDDELMAELRARYRPDVEELSEYLGRDLISLWGYNESPSATP
jgi:hypothetical protein